jgi:hypothetical protein
MRFRNPGIFLTPDPGWRKNRIRILDKHPRSATLLGTVRKVVIPTYVSVPQIIYLGGGFFLSENRHPGSLFCGQTQSVGRNLLHFLYNAGYVPNM